MSYDLLVFDPEVAPRDRVEFQAWFVGLGVSTNGRNAPTPEEAAGKLGAFYDRLRRHYPPMNGPDAPPLMPPAPAPKPGLLARLLGLKTAAPPTPAPFKEAFLTDYSFLPGAIYLGFAWSIAAEAYSDVVSAAIATGLGLYDISGPGGAVLHDRAELEQLDIL